MHVYALTDLGKKVVSRCEGGGTEMKVLSYIRENRTVTSDELEVVGGSDVIYGLKRRGLVKELTQFVPSLRSGHQRFARTCLLF
jgi:hypothetical protein